MEPDKSTEILSIDEQENSSDEITVSGINLLEDKVTPDTLVLHSLAGSALSSSLNYEVYNDSANQIKINPGVWNTASIRDDSVDAIASSVYEKISDKIKESSSKEVEELKEKLQMLLDLKIKVLPAISTGVYLIEFPKKTFTRDMKEILEKIKEELDKRFSNDNILLYGINSMEEITEESINKRIKDLEKLKKELKKNEKF